MLSKAPTSDDHVLKLRHHEGIVPIHLRNILVGKASLAGASKEQADAIRLVRELTVEKFVREHQRLGSRLVQVDINVSSLTEEVRVALVGHLFKMGFSERKKPELKIHVPEEIEAA